jgi:hypothetical protein
MEETGANGRELQLTQIEKALPPLARMLWPVVGFDARVTDRSVDRRAPSAAVEGEHDRPVSGQGPGERHRRDAHSQLLEMLLDAGVDRLS